MTTYCAVERDLAAYERRMAAEDRIEIARERAIEDEFKNMIARPTSCWVDEVVNVRLRDVIHGPIDATLSKSMVRIDLESVFRAIAEERVEKFAALFCEDHAKGWDL